MTAKRVPRHKATGTVEQVLSTVAAQDAPIVRAVTQVSVFGSYARGALDVGDVDLFVETELTRELAPLLEEWQAEGASYLLSGRPPPKRLEWSWQVQRALTSRRLLQIHVDHSPGGETVEHSQSSTLSIPL